MKTTSPLLVLALLACLLASCGPSPSRYGGSQTRRVKMRNLKTGAVIVRPLVGGDMMTPGDTLLYGAFTADSALYTVVAVDKPKQQP